MSDPQDTPAADRRRANEEFMLMWHQNTATEPPVVQEFRNAFAFVWLLEPDEDQPEELPAGAVERLSRARVSVRCAKKRQQGLLI